MAMAKWWLGAVCSLESISWLDGWLLPCPIKMITGVDCPGCGFQRSLFLLLQGHWHESFRLYPPTLPLLILSLYLVLKGLFGFDKQGVVMKVLAVTCGWFVLAVYFLKLWHGHHL